VVIEDSRSPDPSRDGSQNGRFTMVNLIHAALRRDLGRLSGAVRGPSLESTVANRLHGRWQFVSGQLVHHHRTEDESLWPLVRPKLADSAEELGVVDKMEAQHRTLAPASAAVERAFAAYLRGTGSADDVAVQLDAMRSVVESHLHDEESQAFALIDKSLSDKEFASFEKATAKGVGIRGAARFFPWILDGAPQEDGEAALRVLPGPLRALCGRRWVPRYEREIAGLWRS
jgi:hypothetical protein